MTEATCGSCGQPAPYVITLHGKPTPACLRHLNHWRTPPAVKDAPCGHGHLTAEAARDCAEWAAAYRVIPPGCGHPNHGNPDHSCEPFLSTPGDNPGEGAG